MSTTMMFGPSDWPLSIRARESAEGITLLLQTDDWREGITIRHTRTHVLALLADLAAAVEAIPDPDPEFPQKPDTEWVRLLVDHDDGAGTAGAVVKVDWWVIRDHVTAVVTVNGCRCYIPEGEWEPADRPPDGPCDLGWGCTDLNCTEHAEPQRLEITVDGVRFVEVDRHTSGWTGYCVEFEPADSLLAGAPQEIER